MQKAVSRDGTTIAFDQSGKGPALILVGGALSDRSSAVTISALLAPHFTVFSYDRRGRGDSGDTPPYAVEREIEDIDALLNEAGGSAFLFGVSSGAVLALEAATKLPGKVRKLAMYEPPFIVDGSRPLVPADYVSRLDDLLASGRRGDAVELFLTAAVEIPAAMVSQMRQAPMWAGMEKIAHTLRYDGRVMGDKMSGKPLPPGRWSSATQPALVIDGGDSPAWMRNGARAAAKALPNAGYRTLPGQTHNYDPAVLVPVLIDFFGGSR